MANSFLIVGHRWRPLPSDRLDFAYDNEERRPGNAAPASDLITRRYRFPPPSRARRASSATLAVFSTPLAT